MLPPPFGTVGRGTLAGERGGGRVPISTRGHGKSFYRYPVMKKVINEFSVSKSQEEWHVVYVLSLR